MRGRRHRQPGGHLQTGGQWLCAPDWSRHRTLKERVISAKKPRLTLVRTVRSGALRCRKVAIPATSLPAARCASCPWSRFWIDLSVFRTRTWTLRGAGRGACPSCTARKRPFPDPRCCAPCWHSRCDGGRRTVHCRCGTTRFRRLDPLIQVEKMMIHPRSGHVPFAPEPLEARRLLAGNVSASGGEVLQLRGDGAANQVRITQNDGAPRPWRSLGRRSARH